MYHSIYLNNRLNSQTPQQNVYRPITSRGSVDDLRREVASLRTMVNELTQDKESAMQINFMLLKKIYALTSGPCANIVIQPTNPAPTSVNVQVRSQTPSIPVQNGISSIISNGVAPQASHSQLNGTNSVYSSVYDSRSQTPMGRVFNQGSAVN